MKPKLPLLLSVFGCAFGLVAGEAGAQAKYNLRWGHYLADGPFASEHVVDDLRCDDCRQLLCRDSAVSRR